MINWCWDKKFLSLIGLGVPKCCQRCIDRQWLVLLQMQFCIRSRLKYLNDYLSIFIKVKFYQGVNQSNYFAIFGSLFWQLYLTISFYCYFHTWILQVNSNGHFYDRWSCWVRIYLTMYIHVTMRNWGNLCPQLKMDQLT